MATHDVEVVVLGAGLAGLSAAYHLRARNVLVLEARARVGGRTLSDGSADDWFNLGAQIVTSPRLLDLCRELGLDVASVADAHFGLVAQGTFSRGRSAELLFLNLRLRPRDKVDFAITVLRLQRLMRRVAKMTEAERVTLDSRPLRHLLEKSRPATVEILNGFCEESTGQSVDSISSLVGLVYTLTAFMDPGARKKMRLVRGGTQQVCRALADRLPSNSLLLDSTVRSVRNVADGVEVTYVRDGQEHMVRAQHVVSALPAPALDSVLVDAPDDLRSALAERSRYSDLVSVSWPVKDGVRTPWEGLFFIPVTDRDAQIGLVTNYGHLAKRGGSDVGGHIVTMANGRKGTALKDLPDSEIIHLTLEDLDRLLPGAAAVLVPGEAVVARWSPVGLPPLQPGAFQSRGVLRHAVGRIRLCGDFTAEPGLAGANNSGTKVAQAVLKDIIES